MKSTAASIRSLRWLEARRHRRAMAPYLVLIDDFICGDISAPEFEMAFLRTVKMEQHIFGHEIFNPLDRLFGDADAYVARPGLRTSPEDLDDDQLRECAIRARTELSKLGFR